MIDTETMYALGQLARAIWPAGDVPPAILDTMLVRPLTGFGLATSHAAAKKADQGQLADLINKIPPGLSDPPGGVAIEDQGPFWAGYYHYLAALDRAKKWGPTHLERAGMLLYGDRWQSDLARALGVGDRRVREWVSGDRRPSAGVWADIAGLLRQRQQAGQALLEEMERG